MEKKEDLRVIKTKQAIRQTFFELLEEKTFEKISVSDITGRAMINRATFYLHYKDKFDLMEQIENEALEKFNSVMELVTNEVLQKVYEGRQPLPHIIPLLSYIEENPHFFTLIAKDNASVLFYQKVAKKYFDRFIPMLPINKDDIWYEYMQTAIVSLVSSVLNQWIERGMQESKEEMADWLTRLYLGNIEVINTSNG